MRNHCKGKISHWDHFSKTSSPYRPFPQLFSRCVCLITNYQNHEQHRKAQKRKNRFQLISTWTLANSPFLLCIVVLLLRLLPHLIGCYSHEFRRWKLPERFSIQLSQQAHVVLNLGSRLGLIQPFIQPRLIHKNPGDRYCQRSLTDSPAGALSALRISTFYSEQGSPTGSIVMACFLYQYFYRASYSKNLLAALSAGRGKPGRQTSLPGYRGTTNLFSRQYFFKTSADRFCACDHQSFQNVDWKTTRPRQEWHANDCRFWKWTLSFFARRTSLDRRYTGIVFLHFSSIIFWQLPVEGRRTAVHPYVHSSTELSHQTIRLCCQYVLVNCLLDKEVFLLKSCSYFVGACKGRARICYKMYIGLMAVG